MGTRLWLAAAFAAMWLAPAAHAADNAAVSPQAQAVLDRMTAFLRAQPTFAIESTATRDEVLAYGYKLQHQEHADVVVRRPAQLRATVEGDLGSRTVVYDAGRLALYSPGDAAYVRTPAPDTLAKLLGGLFDAGVDLPLADVVYQATEGTLADGARGGVLVGTATVDGVACDHLAFRQANVDWQLWVQQGDMPVPRKIVITTRYEVGEPQYQAVLRWNLAPRIDAATFAFDPPKGAVEVPLANAAALQGGAP
jgi:hypothetical protein